MKKNKIKIDFEEILNATVVVPDPETDPRFKGGMLWGVACEYQGAHASLWANHTAKPPTQEDNAYLESIRRDVAEEVADALEQEGYTINK